VNVEQIARVCHEVNEGYCLSMGDTGQLSWDEAPNWQRSSAISGVRYHMDNPDAGPEGTHIEWCRSKLADGWKYGPKKDVKAKNHPCLVLFKYLPIEQQAKGHIFRSIVHALTH